MQQEQRDWVRLVCTRTGMPAAAQQKLEAAARTAFSSEVWQAAEGLTDPDRAQQSWECLKSLLAPDPDGWKILFVQLSRTRETAQRLARSGFTEKEIWDTLEAFSRFVREREAAGFLDFDRDFWTWRQTSGRVVRLGCLEYEPLDDCVMLHIPSDAQLTEEEVDASLTRAKKRWGTRAFYCDSWLLAPALDELLPAQSRIRSFRARFEQESARPEGTEFVRWVFDCTPLPPDQWPEKTRLQKAIKAHVCAGGKIGSARGRLK